jgi:hypothetical protein
MLVFLDRNSAIRVVRVERAGSGRVHLGYIRKRTWDFSKELQAALTAEEVEEVNGVVSMYRRAEGHAKALNVYGFPEIVRDVVEHITSAATAEVERRILVTALMDAARQVRRFQRQLDLDDSTAAERSAPAQQ